MAKLRLGIILDNLLLPAWKVHVIRSLISSDHTELASYIINKPATHPTPFLLSLYNNYDNRKALAAPDALALQNASELLAETPSSINSEVDVILDLGNGKFDHELQKFARFGVLSFFFGSPGGDTQPGAQEVLHNEPVTMSGLMWRTADGEQRIIYRSFSLTDPSSIKATMNRCYWKSASFPGRVLKKLHEDPKGLNAVTTTQVPEHGHLSNISFATAFVSKTTRRIINRIKRGNTRKEWVLMYDNITPGKTIDLTNFKRLEAPRGFFWADPIVIEKDNKHFIFIEEYVYATGRGRLAVIEQKEDGSFSEAVPILEKPYHLSYPFVFDVGGTYYMIPESSENNTIDLYQCTDFPHRWEFKRTLMENICAVDTTVLQHNGRWWLFANLEQPPGASSLDELSIFYTDDIINSKLIAHPKNPVISDVRQARPAGPFYIFNGALFRPSQVCAPYYGWGISIDRVLKLTETEYEEQPETLIRPASTNGIHGVHTLSYAGNLCVVDAIAQLKK